MADSQIGIYMTDNSLKDNYYWKRLISLFAVAGQTFEIHCWKEETEVIKAALEFGKEKSTDWSFGAIIEGVVDDKFIDMLSHIDKPQRTELCNKMTPYFSIFFENGFSSEHYGTEIHILKVPSSNSEFTTLLEVMDGYATIYEM